MHAQPAEIGGKTGGTSARARRRRVQHRTVETLDKRTAASRRAMQLMQQFETELGGGLTDGQKLAVSRAAVMTAIAEDARLRKLGGAKDVSLDDLVRLDRVAALAVRALGIGDRKRESADTGLGALLREDRRSGVAESLAQPSERLNPTDGVELPGASENAPAASLGVKGGIRP
jgi:hypothetical protein